VASLTPKSSWSQMWSQCKALAKAGGRWWKQPGHRWLPPRLSVSQGER